MRCPICRQETFAKGDTFRPFCSERCRLIDLDNWLADRYRISAPSDKLGRGEGGTSCGEASGETMSETQGSGE